MPVYANALIDIVGLVIVIIVMFADRRIALPARESQPVFRVLLGLITCILLFDIPAWLLDGSVFPGARILCYTLDTLYYLCQIVYCYFWLLFSDGWNRRPGMGQIRRKRLYALPMLLELAVILLNPLTGWVFTIGADNVYVRGTYYLLNLIPYYLYITGSIGLTVWGFLATKEAEGKRQSLSLIVFMSLPLCGVALETVFYGVSWIWPFTALSLLMVYLSVQQQLLTEQRMEALRRAEEAAELKGELANSRIAIMLSQIQPHFLYNALNTIQYLTCTDPATASDAIEHFARFLRGNMDSLTARTAIPLKKELEHLENYLYIEQLRFEHIRICYDIRAEGIRLPALTLQPLVENAIRYGLRPKEYGGTVTIATREEAEAYIVTVSDDGVGFNPDDIQRDGRSHIGISNTKNRVETLCGGQLRYVSVPGAGTSVTITLPKAEQGASAL